MKIKLLSYEDEFIRLSFDKEDVADEIEIASIELLNDPAMSDIKSSLRKYKLIQKQLNNLFDEDEDYDDE